METFKQINFTYEEGYFSYPIRKTIKIKINRHHIIYDLIYEDSADHLKKVVKWKSQTNQYLYWKLQEDIESALFIDEYQKVIVLDGPSTLISAKPYDGKKITQFIQSSFYDNGLDKLANTLRKMLRGIKLPYFLLKEDEEDDSNEDESIFLEDMYLNIHKNI